MLLFFIFLKCWLIVCCTTGKYIFFKFKFAVFFFEKCWLIICCAAGKDGDPRCGAAGAEDTAQRRVSIGKKCSKKITITIEEKGRKNYEKRKIMKTTRYWRYCAAQSEYRRKKVAKRTITIGEKERKNYENDKLQKILCSTEWESEEKKVAKTNKNIGEKERQIMKTTKYWRYCAAQSEYWKKSPKN